MREVDIERHESHDLLQQQLWDDIWKEIQENLWDVVVLTPPCNSFSRARCNQKNNPGPVPVRNINHPWGFPWLTGSNFQLVQDHNFLVLQCLATMRLCCEHDTDYLFEHPEDLGLTSSGDRPASVWQLEEMRSFVLERGAFTFAIYQCHFGASSPKPTRLLTSLQLAATFPFGGFPTFDLEGHYLGPFPSNCTHDWHERRLVGKENGQWKTSGSAAYPPGLCKWLAQLIVSRKGDLFSELNTTREPTVVEAVEASAALEHQNVDQELDERQTKRSQEDAELRSEQQQQQLHRGQPLVLEWAGKQRQLVDGFGLCSPTLWEPEARGAHLEPAARELCNKLFGTLTEFVRNKFQDPRREAIKLGLGHIASSPFSREELQKLREYWAALLPSSKTALVVPERQPFLLGMIGQSLEIMGDPDYAIFMEGKDSFWTGVPVGFDEPLPRTPSVFPKKEKVRPLDESEYNNIASNYKSAVEMADEMEAKFRQEEALGRMVPTTLGEIKVEYPDRIPLVAAMGAIRKPNGPEDAAAMLRWVEEEKDSFFALSADISSAHRLVKIRKCDWPLLGCKVRTEDKTVWLNTVGTFGVSSASYWWSRLFSGIGRLNAYILNHQKWHQLVYVDDLHLTCLGERKFVNLWIALLVYEILGTPFSYGKFSGGLQVQFVGYLLDYRECLLGITKRRGDWLVTFIDDMLRSNGTIYMRRFNEFLGRLGFVSRVLIWLKPFLAPLYTWSSALDKSSVATSPKLVLLVLRFLRERLHECTYMNTCLRPETMAGELFRTDAKCETGRVVLGGHHLVHGEWFALEVGPSQAPFLFKESGDSQWASTTAELLAVLIALHLFGCLKRNKKEHPVPFRVTAGTDNKANDHLLRKGLTTKWPLCLVFMQLTVAIMSARVFIQLGWRPRDENAPADALTNLDFCKL
eukprot:s408_g31.t1